MTFTIFCSGCGRRSRWSDAISAKADPRQAIRLQQFECGSSGMQSVWHLETDRASRAKRLNGLSRNVLS
jgi:hypothetical protein